MTTTTTPPRDGHGCDITGWSRTGAHLRRQVRRMYLLVHGECRYCGQPLDQYRECADCGEEI
jgi:5-methylcytosine-specific restriction endonuclease McrA